MKGNGHSGYVTTVRADMLRLAVETRKILTGSVDQIFEIAKKAEVVFCVWPDRTKPDGVDMMVVKGDDLLDRAARGDAVEPVRVASIPCSEADQAMMLKECIGASTETLQ